MTDAARSDERHVRSRLRARRRLCPHARVNAVSGFYDRPLIAQNTSHSRATTGAMSRRRLSVLRVAEQVVSGHPEHTEPSPVHKLPPYSHNYHAILCLYMEQGYRWQVIDNDNTRSLYRIRLLIY